MKKTIHLQQPTPASLAAEIETVIDGVRQRAYSCFQRRNGRLGSALEDWLTAEREIVWRPPIEVSEHDGQVVVEAAIAGVEPEDIELQVTRDTMIITAEPKHVHPAAKGQVHLCEFSPGRLFRTIPMPVAIDPEAVKAKYQNGLLTVTAEVAPGSATSVPIHS